MYGCGRVGLGYIATPTRWALIEPHFTVPLLSWSPRKLLDRYVRLTGKGNVYNVDPLGPPEIRAGQGRPAVGGQTLAVFDELVRVENPTAAAKLLAASPEWVRQAAKPALGTSERSG